MDRAIHGGLSSAGRVHSQQAQPYMPTLHSRMSVVQRMHTVRDDRVADGEHAEELAQQHRPRLALPRAPHQPLVAEVEPLGALPARAWSAVAGGARIGGRQRCARAARGSALDLGHTLPVSHAANATLQAEQQVLGLSALVFSVSVS